MLEMSRHICRRQKCGDNCCAHGSLENVMENFNNPLPPEILCRVLGYLPQNEMVENRSVCRYWRNTIDQHCPLTVTFEENDKYLYQKLQRRISECKINWLPSANSRNIKFAYPQSMRSISFLFESDVAVGNVCRLLKQVKPYLHSLEIDFGYLKKNNIFTLPYAFPLVRKLTITPTLYLFDTLTLPENLDTLFSHRMPSLKILNVFFAECYLPVADEIQNRLFTFLSMHRQSIKHLDVLIDTKEELTEFSETFDLPTELKSLLCNGQLQLEHFTLCLPFPPRYLSVWTTFLESQNNLILLKVCCSKNILRRDSLGIPFNKILAGIQSSFSTLRTLSLKNILSVGHDGRTWIPLDCTVLRGASNLTNLQLERNLNTEVDDATPEPKENDGAEIINLGEIPLASLKDLDITYFVCDSGELQTLVDNSPMLEILDLYYTQAPPNSPKFASTGVQGGTIQSFMNKPNKIRIDVMSCINDSNQEENDVLETVKLLYPHQSEETGSFCWEL